MTNKGSRFIAACILSAGPLMLSTTSSPAWADAPTSAQIDALIEDINAHKQLCDTVTSAQEALYKQCANEQASLVARQQQLGVSDDALNGKLKSRGWRWP